MARTLPQRAHLARGRQRGPVGWGCGVDLPVRASAHFWPCSDQAAHSGVGGMVWIESLSGSGPGNGRPL
jgi:hypothetical protein